LLAVKDAEGFFTRFLYDRLGRRAFLVERFTDFASPTTGIGGGTDNDQDRVTKWAYNGLGNVTALTAYNGSSGSTQVTEYKYASTIDANWPTLIKYPDGNTTIGMGEDNVQLAYHTDGTLNTRKDQRGTVLTFAYDPLRRPESLTATTLGGADPFVGQSSGCTTRSAASNSSPATGRACRAARSATRSSTRTTTSTRSPRASRPRGDVPRGLSPGRCAPRSPARLRPAQFHLRTPL
jgi:YD repeat-containing protein